jgi:outer membrane protein assembly factor BamB
MKLAKILLLAVTALLPLTSISCGGAAQATGGWSGPTVHEGVVYAGTRDGRVVAINLSTRETQWEWPDTTGVRSLLYATPIVQGDLVYVGTYGGEVYALDKADGEVKWVYPPKGEGYIGGLVGNHVIANGTIYISSSDGRVYALNATNGKPKWGTNRTLAYKLWTRPAVVGDTIYVSTFDGRVYALSTETGELLDWSFEAEAGFCSSPVIDEDIIYLGSFDRHLYAIEVGRNVSMWRFPEEEPAGNWYWASPVVNQGIVYAGCLDGKLHAIDAETGEGLWEFDAGSPIVSSPVLTDNLLIITNESGTVYVFDVSTEFGDEAVPLKTISIGASVRSPLYVSDGLVYIRGEDNSICVVDIDKGEVVEGWPVSLTAEE